MEEDDDDDDDDEETTDPKLQLLMFIAQAVQDNGKLEVAQISEEEGLADDETADLINQLKSEGLIETDATGNVTGITDAGMKALEADGEGEDGGDNNEEGKENNNNQAGEESGSQTGALGGNNMQDNTDGTGQQQQEGNGDENQQVTANNYSDEEIMAPTIS